MGPPGFPGRKKYPAVRGERRKIRSLCGSLKTSHRRGIRSQSATRFSALRGASRFSKYFKKKRDTELDGAVRRRSRFVQRVPHRRPRCSKMPTRLPAKGLQRSVAEYKASAKKKTKELRSQVTGARVQGFQGLRFSAYGLKFRVQGLGFRIQGFRV